MMRIAVPLMAIGIARGPEFVPPPFSGCARGLEVRRAGHICRRGWQRRRGALRVSRNLDRRGGRHGHASTARRPRPQGAPFTLPATDGKTYSLADLKGARGTLVMFICNHCPYVEASIDRAIADAKALSSLGIATVAICSNDAKTYPDDSFRQHARLRQAPRLPLPLPARRDAEGRARLRRRVHARLSSASTTSSSSSTAAGSTRAAPSRRKKGAKRELLDAMEAVAKRGKAPAEQAPSVGCSIKWK